MAVAGTAWTVHWGSGHCGRGLGAWAAPLTVVERARKAVRKMAWRSSGRSNAELVHNLKTAGLIRSPAVERAFLAVDRKFFVPLTDGTPSSSARGARERHAPRREELIGNDPYQDSPQYIGYSATISAPHMHAMCAELLLPYIGRAGAHVLDVGSGTGYLTTIFAKMSEYAQGHHEGAPPRTETEERTAMPVDTPSGGASSELARVYGIDHIRGLVDDARRNVELSNPELVQQQRIFFRTGDGRLGWPEHAPYDAIHVGAAADPVPAALLQQLKPGGRMVIPLGPEGGEQILTAIDRDEHDPERYVQKAVTAVRYVPLCEREYQWQGEQQTEEEEALMGAQRREEEDEKL